MKSRLAILSAAAFAPFVLFACGEEAPPVLGSGNQTTTEGNGTNTPTMPGTLLTPPPAPQTVTPGNPMDSTAQVNPGDPLPVMPGVVPGDMPPAAVVSPGTATPATTDSMGRPVPLMPPLTPPTPADTAVTPPAMPGTTVAPTPTPEPAVTPTPEPAAPMCEDAFTVGSSGFVSAPGSGGACWQGYAWASATPEGESTITPEDFSDCGGGCKLCVSGTVAPTEDFSGVGMLGLNINQLASSSSTGKTEVTGAVSVNVTNAGGSPLRVQLTGAKDWCVDITGESGAINIPLSDFVTECWEGGNHVEYDGEPVEALILLVPGSDTDETDFDVCLNSVSP